MKTNFDALREKDFYALVDLLCCYQPGHKCKICSFSKYGFAFNLCNGEGSEEKTIEWLGKPYSKFEISL